MYPEPRKKLFPSPKKRLSSRRKAVTVCIAGINYSQPSPIIIVACDRKISFFGGYFTAEGIAMKVTGINRNWSLMCAGPTSPLVPLVEAIKEGMAKQKATGGVRRFARQCSTIYNAERPELIEREVLVDYGIDTYAEYLDTKKSEPQLYAAITEKIKEEEEKWSLLFAGFDSKKQPHIFVVSERGRIQYCDTEGFAAIGSGGWRSLVALSSYQFKRNLPFSQAVFGIAAAKFAAESEAEGVGKETILAILEPKTKASPVMSDRRMDSLKALWSNLPRFPKEAEAEVWDGINEMTFIPEVKNNPLFRAFLVRQREVRPLTSQTSVPVP